MTNLRCDAFGNFEFLQQIGEEEFCVSEEDGFRTSGTVPDVNHKPGHKPCCLHLEDDNPYVYKCYYDLPWVDNYDQNGNKDHDCSGARVNCRQPHSCWNPEEEDECTTCDKDVTNCLDFLAECPAPDTK